MRQCLMNTKIQAGAVGAQRKGMWQGLQWSEGVNGDSTSPLTGSQQSCGVSRGGLVSFYSWGN